MHKILNVEYIDQSVRWPTGCESVSAVMALRFLGLPITVDEFIEKDLACKDLHREHGVLYGPDPNKYFIGDPHTNDDGSYGCYAGAIMDAIKRTRKRYPDFGWEPINLTGLDVEMLAEKYVQRGVPVIFWATMDMEPVRKGGQWKLEDGTDFVWPAGEHCLVLTGHTDHGYRFHDPRTGTAVIYASDICEARFQELGRQAVPITPL